MVLGPLLRVREGVSNECGQGWKGHSRREESGRVVTGSLKGVEVRKKPSETQQPGRKKLQKNVDGLTQLLTLTSPAGSTGL